MSFYINSTELKEAYFNGSEVSSIYYNGTLVWDSWEWPGWSAATWQDIYKLCKQKQAGSITAWPSDVVLGATKTVTLSTAVLGTSSTTMRIIGLDHDGSGTITFQTVNTLSTSTAWCSSTASASNAKWSTSIARIRCNTFYTYCEAKPYIKQVSKKTYYCESSTTSTLQTENIYCFLLSQSELTGSGLSEGSQYDYFTSTTTMKKNQTYWLRTTTDGSYTQAQRVTTSGVVSGLAKTTVSYLAPCFVIG